MKTPLFKQIRNVSSKCLSTWSPLADAFNNAPVQGANNAVGLFNIPGLTSHTGFFDLKDECIHETDNLIKEITSKHRSRKMVQVFDDLSDSLCKVADLAEFIRIAHPSSKYTLAAENACGAVVGIVEKLNTNVTLYNALKHVVEKGDIIQTDHVDEHVSKLFMFDFEQCGIHLPEAARCQVVAINDYILNLGQNFVAYAFDSREINKSLVPKSVRDIFPCEEGNLIVSGLYSDSTNSQLREIAYKIFLQPDQKQQKILTNLLEARNELAQLCGFETYSQRALKGSTVETPKMVMEFLDLLNGMLKDRAALDFKLMNQMKSRENHSSLECWDTPYFTKKAKKDWFEVGASSYSPYFSLGTCMDGLNTVMESLYGISLVNTVVNVGETWASDIYKLSVIHETEGLLGYIYCDFFERPGKPNQDCHFTIRGGKTLEDGSYQQPVVVVMLNLNVPRWSSPSLLSPGMVDNLFHEMGHAMHSMLARTKYQHVTGTRCCIDFAEVPSVLMEYFSADERVIKTFARHFQTGEPMPDDMIKRLCATKHLFAASETQLQVFYAALDQIYHGQHPLSGTTTQVLADTQNKYYGLAHIENTAWQLRFSHLVGYGAKYYSYLMSKAIASWIWQTYFQQNPLSRMQGERYRREFLAHGGGKPSGELVADFLQRDVTAKHLAESLINDLDVKKQQLVHVLKNVSE